MDSREFVLAALAPANGEAHSPVQVQKLLFILERTVGENLGGPFFNFQPYNYGPFDKQVYATLDELASEGLATVSRERSYKMYQLTSQGQKLGDELLAKLAPETCDYMSTLSRWIRSLGFSALVSAVYKAYPEMRENSVFQENA